MTAFLLSHLPPPLSLHHQCFLSIYLSSSTFNTPISYRSHSYNFPSLSCSSSPTFRFVISSSRSLIYFFHFYFHPSHSPLPSPSVFVNHFLNHSRFLFLFPSPPSFLPSFVCLLPFIHALLSLLHYLSFSIPSEFHFSYPPPFFSSSLRPCTCSASPFNHCFGPSCSLSFFLHFSSFHSPYPHWRGSVAANNHHHSLPFRELRVSIDLIPPRGDSPP